MEVKPLIQAAVAGNDMTHTLDEKQTLNSDCCWEKKKKKKLPILLAQKP